MLCGARAGTLVVDGNVADRLLETHQTVAAGWSLFEIDCNDGDSGGDVAAATATFNVATDETVICVFTNWSDTDSTVNLGEKVVT